MYNASRITHHASRITYHVSRITFLRFTHLIMAQTVTIEGVTLHLSHPDELPMHWVGQGELMAQLIAAWLIVDKNDLPLNPRLIGKPGVGKTTLAYAAGKRINREVYLFQATIDTRPEDLLVTPVISGDGKIQYMASSIVTAMIRGGVAILDEGNRMSEKSWASLAPLLDTRRYVESIVAGIKIDAHPNFRFCATMNDDASTFELPEYVHSRIQPQIFLDFPEREEELKILSQNLPFADEDILNYVVNFLQLAHLADERYTVRDGINITRYALKLLKTPEKLKRLQVVSSSQGNEKNKMIKKLRQAVSFILGEDALVYLQDL
jgi:MoxR-like ATPase